MTINLLPVGLVVGTTVFWAITQVLSGIAVKDTSMSVYSSLSHLFAALLIGSYLMFTGGLYFPDLWLVIVAAIGGIVDSFIGFMLYLHALKRAETHVVTSLSNTAPFWGVLTAVLFLGEAARVSVFVSAFLVVLGSFLMISIREMNRHDIRNQGAILAIAAGIVWGISETIPTKYCLNNGMSPFIYLFIMTAVACAAWFVLASVNGARGRLKYSARGIRISAFAGFFGVFLAWLLWLSALNMEQASLLAPVRGLVVPFGFLFSILIVKEKPTKKAFLGLFLILAGLILVSISA